MGSLKMCRRKEKERGWKEGEEEEEERGGRILFALTWNSCFSAVRWRWILAHFLSILQLYLCCQIMVFGGTETYFFQEREKENQFDSAESRRRFTRMQSCEEFLLVRELLLHGGALTRMRLWRWRFDIGLKDFFQTGFTGSEEAWGLTSADEDSLLFTTAVTLKAPEDQQRQRNPKPLNLSHC